MYDYTSCLYPTCMNIHPTYIPYVLIYILPISHCTKVIGSIPEGDQKGHKYTCFARSALFTGNLNDLMHWFAIKSMISMTGGLTPPISENSHFSPQAGNKCQVTWCSHEGSDARGKSGYTTHFFYAVSCRYAHKLQHICAYEKKCMSTSDLLSDILNT